MPRRRIWGVAALLAALLLAVRPASAQDRAPVDAVTGLFDDELLQAAVENIGTMSYGELAALRRYLATCIHERLIEPVAQHACDVALAEFEIEFAAERPLDTLLEVVAATHLTLRNEEAEHRPHDYRTLKRLSDLEYRLRQQASIRFRQLRATPH